MKYLKKIVLVLLSVFAFAFLSYSNLKADEPGQAAPATATDATEVSNSDDGYSENDEVYGEGEEIDPYHNLNFIKLYQSGIILSEDFPTEPSYEPNTDDNRLIMTATLEDINAGRIVIDHTLNFDKGIVSRITTDVYSEEGVSGELYIYLDDETTPVVVTRIEEFAPGPEEGNYSVNVIDKAISGEHKVSLRFNLDGIGASESTKLYFKHIEFAEFSIPFVNFNIDESKGTIDAMNASPDHSANCYGTVDIIVPDGYKSEYTGNVEKSITGLEMEYLRGRGNSTWQVPKKPYKFKLKSGKNIFGMGKNKHWVLIADFFDNSHMRNRMTYWMGAAVGLEYTPQCIPVEVMMNGHFFGTYLLAEQIRIGNGRVEIDELSDDDYDDPIITGGYLVSMAPYATDPDESKFKTKQGMSFINDSPDFYESGNDTQRDYIRDYFQKTEDAIFGEGFKDKDGKSYKYYMDFDSTVNYWWIQEFSMNRDSYSTPSTYLYKKREGKLFWGPLWDFDFVAWGDLEYFNDRVNGFNNTKNIWSTRLKDDPEFCEALADRWTDVEAILEEIVKDGGLLDRYYDEMRISESYNYELWGYYQTTCETYKEEVDDLRNWIINRRKWVNDNFDDLTDLKYTVTYMAQNKVYKTEDVMKGTALQSLPKAPKIKGKVFIGWYTKDGEKYEIPEGEDNSNYYKDDFTLYAKYVNRKDVVLATDIYFQDSALALALGGEPFKLEYTTYPADSIVADIIWSSSDENVATVDENGKVTFVNEGKTVITATLENGHYASIKLMIYKDAKDEEKYQVKSMKLEKSIVLYVGEYKQLLPVCDPEYNCSAFIYLMADDSIATVDDFGVITGVKPGVTTYEVGSYSLPDTVKCKVTVLEKKDDPDVDKAVVMYRLYNPNSGEHFYTGSVKEKEDVIAAGWKDEGVAWKAPKTSKTPVYRLYNPNAGDHHYTVSEKEKNDLVKVGWKYEGIGWYSDDNKGVAIQRLYNPNATAGSHHFTVSIPEKDNLVTAGWKYEGIAWYGKE